MLTKMIKVCNLSETINVSRTGKEIDILELSFISFVLTFQAIELKNSPA